MRKRLDAYPTESSLARQLLAFLASIGYYESFRYAFEPCAGAGQLARPLRTAFSQVFTNDVDQKYGSDWSFDATQSSNWSVVPRTEWVITNPPFSSALPIIENALTHATIGVAMLLRLSFLEPTSTENARMKYPRSSFLKDATDQLRFLMPVGSPRPSFTPDGKTDSVTTAWFVWDKGWSWNREMVYNPFQFITNWKGN